MARIVIESVFEHPMSDEDFAEMSTRLDPCLKVRHAAWRRSYVSTDRLRLTCEYEAPDAESVREARRAAGHPFERVWAAHVFAVEDRPDLKAELEALHRRKR